MGLVRRFWWPVALVGWPWPLSSASYRGEHASKSPNRGTHISLLDPQDHPRDAPMPHPSTH
eukprot:5422623-Prymnesium_polylepis.1